MHALVQALERGLADNHFRHLVLVAPPRMLGVLRESLSRGLADRLRASLAKDWGTSPTPSCHSRRARWWKSGRSDCAGR